MLQLFVFVSYPCRKAETILKVAFDSKKALDNPNTRPAAVQCFGTFAQISWRGQRHLINADQGSGSKILNNQLFNVHMK